MLRTQLSISSTHSLKTLARVFGYFLLACLVPSAAIAQDAAHSVPDPNPQSDGASRLASPNSASIALEVPQNTSLQVALGQQVRVQRVGQSVTGRIVESVFAFDKLVIPSGSVVEGEVTQIRPINRTTRVKAYLDADFTPSHPIEVRFHALKLPDGTRVPIQTIVTPGSGEVMRFLTAPQSAAKSSIRDQASEKAREAKQEAQREWNAAMQQVTQPGRFHRVERYLVAQLPVHPQYIDAGSIYFAELQAPLNFGSEPLTDQTLTQLDRPLPPNSFVRARLLTPLDSRTAHVTDPVDAILLRPLTGNDGSLFLPAGTRLQGSVTQAAPARSFSRNGQLRIGFRELIPPPELTAAKSLKIEGDLQGIQSASSGHLRLDSEGGARAADPSSKYIHTALTVGLAAVSFGVGGDTLGDTTERAAGGAGGYKLIGILLGTTVHSQPFGMAMGAVGAARSIYIHFIARGRDVIFPKNTSMDIALGTHRSNVR